MIFIDTSALVALLDADDRYHIAAERIWTSLINTKDDNELVCNNYVLLEACSLIQRRYGMQVLRTFQEQAVPLLTVDWIGPERHAAAIAAVLVANRRGLSLVDCASFETMRRLGIRTAFAFDPHCRWKALDR